MSAEDLKTDRELLLDIRHDVKDLVSCKEDHEIRLRAVEGNFFKVMSVAGFIGFLSGWFGKMLGGNP
jgi:hypothetical protein